MDGFTLKGVPVPVVVRIDEASLKSASGVLDGFVKELQKKCNLTLSIDTSAAQSVLSQLQTSMRSLRAGGRSAIVGGQQTNAALYKNYANTVRDLQIKADANWLTSDNTRAAIAEMNRLYGGYRQGAVAASQMQAAIDNVNRSFREEAAAAKDATSEVERASRSLNAQRNKAIQSASNEFYRTWESYSTQYKEFQQRITEGQYSSQASKDAIASLKTTIDGYAEGTKSATDLKFAVEKVTSAFREEAAAAKDATSEVERMQSRLLNQLQNGHWLAGEQSRIAQSYPNASTTLVAQANSQLEILENGDLAKVAAGDEAEIRKLNAALDEYLSIVGRISRENTATNTFQDQATAIANLKSQYQDYMSKFGQNLQHNLPLMEKFQKFGEDLSAGGPSNELQRRWAELTAEAKRAGVEVQTVRQRMTHLFGQHFNTALIMLAIRGLRQALRQLWQDIKEVNEALVQTQIVTGLSGAALEAYTDKAYAAADKSKDKVTNILSEATAFGRLGYDSELSVQLAQLTSMYSKLGDVDTSDATDAITALMKAFDLKSADEIELALDKMIYVGNNFPISAAGLGEGLNNAASALSSAGNSLEQTLALLMAANATVQNPSKSSTAMRTITARIRNTKAELDELGEELDEKYDTVAKYQKELLGLTGVDILDATGKNFRATYDILKDLADVWGTLTSAQQAAVTTMLAGTRNQDIFASLMKNFPSAEEAMGGIGDAAGLMDEKFKAVEDSISGALSGLSNAWSKFSNTLVNTDSVISAVKALEMLVNVLDSVTKFTGGAGLLSLASTIALVTRQARDFNQTWPELSTSLSLVNAYGGSGDYAAAAAALNGYSAAQQRAILFGSNLTKVQKAQIKNLLLESSGRKLLTSSLVEEAIASKNVGLSDAKQVSVKAQLSSVLSGTKAITDDVVVSKLNELVADETLSVKEAQLIATQLGLQVVLVKTTSDTGAQTIALRLLGNEYSKTGIKAKTFVGGTGKLSVGLMLLITVISTVVNNIRKLREEAEDTQRQTRQSLIDSQRASSELVSQASAASDKFSSGAKSLSDYQAKLNSIADKLEKTEVGTDAYRDASLELYEVQNNIVEQFGVEADAVRGLTGDLRGYARELDKVQAKKWLSDMTGSDNYAGLSEVLKYFGYDADGKTLGTQQFTIPVDLKIGTISKDSYSAFAWLLGDSMTESYKEYDGGSQAWTIPVFGNVDSRVGSEDELRNYLATLMYKIIGNELSGSVHLGDEVVQSTSSDFWGKETLSEMPIVIDSISGSFTSIINLIDALDRRYRQFSGSTSSSDQEIASYISQLIGQIKDAIGYDEALPVFQQWAKYSLLAGEFGDEAYNAAAGLMDASAKYQEAIQGGDATKITEAINQFNSAVNTFKSATSDIPLANDFLSEFLTKYDKEVSPLYQDWASGRIHADRTQTLLRQMSRLSAGGYVDIANRPMVSSRRMQASGWSEFPNDSYATLYSSTFSNRAGTVYMNFTPILPDGSVLTPDALREYAESVVNGGQDWRGLRIGPAFPTLEMAESAAIEAHKLSEEYLDGKTSYGINTDDLKAWISEYGLSVESIKYAGEQFASIESAEAEGFGKDYRMFTMLTEVAQEYGKTLDEVLSAAVQFANLPIYANSIPKYITDSSKPSDYDNKYSFSGQATPTEATERVGSIDKRAGGFLDARSLFLHTISPYMEEPTNDVWKVTEEEAEQALDAINEYFGTSFEEITEENCDAILDLFNTESEDIYGMLETGLKDTLDFLASYAEEYDIPMENMFDVESGMLNIEALIASFDSIPASANKAGALAYALLAQKLMGLASMSFRLVQVGDQIKVVASDGYTTPPPAKTGGGGGGKKSKISSDIDTIERLIKLFKELLNYYDEGSEQWIARQRQIIDKYKAGVEIAMAEYDRLIKKGLKQTDDDVKKIVDTILEYQGDIFEESKKLWEAVRQNQIDALKHTKDQIDATIELEKTHHDLLIAIRNERRELEDELKAARDAYSEVMTTEELDALFSADDYAELMDKLAGIEGDAMALYRDYKEQIAAVSEDETYMIEHITDEFKRQYDLKMKEYEIAKAELGVARAQQDLENVKNEQTVMMLIDGRWQWVADPEKVLEAEQKLADAEQELADAQDEYDFQSLIHSMEAQSSGIQQQIDALEALTFSMDDLAEQIHLFSDSVYKELLTYLSQIAQSIFDKYEGDTAVPAFADGGVIKRGGLAMVHSGEPIFSTADAEKLWRFVHDLGDTPVNTLGVYSGIANKLLDPGVDTFGGVSTVAIDNSINIPGGIHVHGEMAQQLITLLKEVVAPYQPNV